MPATRSLALTAALVLSFGGAACTSSDEASVETEQLDAEPPTATEILKMSGSAMADISSVAFTITQEGAEVPIDEGGLVTFTAADGRYAAPGSAEAIVAVDALGAATEIGAVAIDGTVWITNPLTGKWEEAPEIFTFDPALIFSTDIGLPALLDDGITDPAPAVPEAAGGVYTITGDVDPARIAALTGGLVTDVTDVEVVIDADTFLIDTLGFAVDVDGTVSTWSLTMSDYDADVTIEPPELG
ncbi:MAG: LppX_LprAFG lipoprotein [Acidimicrobiales bacterium]